MKRITPADLVLHDWQIELMKKGNGTYRDLYRKINQTFGPIKQVSFPHNHLRGIENVKTKRNIPD